MADNEPKAAAMLRTSDVETKLVAQLKRFDTPTICNSIELFEVRPRNVGFADHRIRCAFPELPPAVGLACTATFRASGPGNGRDPYGQVERLCRELDTLTLPGVVVCQDLDEPVAAATFGEIMCSVYKGLGAVGLITSGAGRDLPQIRSLEFPVFLGGTIAAHAHCHAVDVGIAVSVGSMRVNRHDLMHADVNGITTIPLEIADELPDVAEAYVKCESIVLAACAGPSGGGEALLAARREMIDQISKLRRRVSRRKNP